MKLDKKKILLIAGILVSIICSWLFARKIEWSSLGEAFREAKYIYIFPTVIILFFAHYIRAIRWEVLLSPIKRVSVLNLFSANMIGFMANNVLPARLGEVIRPIMIARKEKIKVSTSLATVGPLLGVRANVERVIAQRFDRSTVFKFIDLLSNIPMASKLDMPKNKRDHGGNKERIESPVWLHVHIGANVFVQQENLNVERDHHDNHHIRVEQ